jgi:hypothetical protein
LPRVENTMQLLCHGRSLWRPAQPPPGGALIEEIPNSMQNLQPWPKESGGDVRFSPDNRPFSALIETAL